MRLAKNPQKPLFCQWSDHRFSKNLASISRILDENPRFIDLVAEDLKSGNKGKDTGSHGMTAEQVLRAAILKQQNGWSYEFLELQCIDSDMTKSFLRLALDESYKKSTLQENISKIKAQTWIEINIGIIQYAENNDIEKGRTIRVDATVVPANIHAPTDSSLLFDCFRVVDRELKKIRKKTKTAYYSPLTTKQAKSLLLDILNAKDKRHRVAFYKEFLKEAKRLLKLLSSIINRLTDAPKINLKHILNVSELLPLIIDQTERRVLKEEVVPSHEKVVSIFEPHTDIIKKGKREVAYGHKVFLTAGKSGLITDCQLVQGNPSDSEYFIDLLERQKEIYSRPPRQVTADGGFASQDNVYDAKDLGVKDICFSKHVGLEIEEMVKSPWVFQKLRNFRAGIEGIISVLKRAYGLSKALWKKVSGYACYVHSSIVAYNLTLIAQLQS